MTPGRSSLVRELQILDVVRRLGVFPFIHQMQFGHHSCVEDADDKQLPVFRDPVEDRLRSLRQRRRVRKSARSPSRLESSATPLRSPSSSAARSASCFRARSSGASASRLMMRRRATRARASGSSARACSRMRAVSAIGFIVPGPVPASQALTGNRLRAPIASPEPGMLAELLEECTRRRVRDHSKFGDEMRLVVVAGECGDARPACVRLLARRA